MSSFINESNALISGAQNLDVAYRTSDIKAILSSYDDNIKHSIYKQALKISNILSTIWADLNFVCFTFESANGDINLLRLALGYIINLNNIAIVLISSNEKKNLSIVSYVPDHLIPSLSASRWISHISHNINADIIYSSDNYAFATMPYSPHDNKFPFKDHDTASASATGLLRQLNLIFDDESDNDEYCFGDHDFPF